MKANELRIGNWVNNFEVDFQLTSKDIYHLDVYVGRVIANPIPITPEWLERAGFVIIFSNSSGKKYSLLKNGVFDSDLTFIYWDSTELKGKVFRNRKEFKYVHQLQNLYFALTGEELELKP